jgi:hypothetical protein
MSTRFTGGCACGAIRYRLASQPFDTGWCHCRLCQLSSGAPAMVFSTVPTADLLFEQGRDRLKVFASTGFGRRSFCGDCGSLLTMQVDFQPETIDFTVATLDDPGAVAPEFHIFHASRIPWFNPGDSLPRHERFRPVTRGLPGKEPPDAQGD